MRLFKFFSLVLFLLFSFSLSAPAFVITPYVINLETEPGQPGTGLINVLNDDNKTCSIKATVMDMYTDKKTGQRLYKPVGKGPSPAKYIKVTPETFVLKAKESKEVKVSVEMPKEMTGGNYAIAIFDSTPFVEKGKPKTSRIVFGLSLGTYILHETKGTVKAASKVKKIDIIPPTDTKPLVLKMMVENAGNTHIIPTATAAIMDDKEQYKGQLSTKERLILPGDTGEIEGEWEGSLSPGTYHALITYQYKPDKVITINKVFEIK
jgi:hypothetical protein